MTRFKPFHGMTNTPTYRSWQSMLDRCRNPTMPNYPRYGGRGITVCDRWKNSFEAFVADMGLRPEGMTLDREDSNGNYEPGNCKWSTTREQGRNRRSIKLNLELATQIALRFLLGEGRKSIAASLGVNEWTVRSVGEGHNWPDAMGAAKEMLYVIPYKPTPLYGDDDYVKGPHDG